MKNILNLLSLLFILHLNAQSTYNSSSIQVTLGDLQTNICDIDSTANALVIYEKGNSYLHRETYKLNTKIEKKVKILNAEGFNKSIVEIYLYNSDDNKREEKIKNIVATTHNLENNQIVKTNIRESEIFRELYNIESPENKKLIDNMKYLLDDILIKNNNKNTEISLNKL